MNTILLGHGLGEVLHIDGDSFFASVYQSAHPETKGKPLVVGQERGIATAVSYEAKRLGIKRGIQIYQLRRQWPECIVANSDYRMYELYSRNMMQIIRSYLPVAERYSIDEGFADLTGHLNPFKIAQNIKEHIESALNITVSAGVARTKTLAKIASSINKPSGCEHITDGNLITYLERTAIEDVWGIGWRTAPRMKSYGIYTALDFYNMPEKLIKTSFNKPLIQTWHELHGRTHHPIDPSKKTTYQSIMETLTIKPTKSRDILFGQLMNHVENCFAKARRYDYVVREIHIYLKTQKFTYHGTTIKFSRPVTYPYLFRKELHEGFDRIYRSNILYRATGCTVFHLQKAREVQPTLFDGVTTTAGVSTSETIPKLSEKLDRIYTLREQGKIEFGTILRRPGLFNIWPGKNAGYPDKLKMGFRGGVLLKASQKSKP